MYYMSYSKIWTRIAGTLLTVIKFWNRLNLSSIYAGKYFDLLTVLPSKQKKYRVCTKNVKTWNQLKIILLCMALSRASLILLTGLPMLRHANFYINSLRKFLRKFRTSNNFAEFGISENMIYQLQRITPLNSRFN